MRPQQAAKALRMSPHQFQNWANIHRVSDVPESWVKAQEHPPVLTTDLVQEMETYAEVERDEADYRAWLEQEGRI
jgi:hypothetical protein